MMNLLLKHSMLKPEALVCQGEKVGYWEQWLNEIKGHLEEVLRMTFLPYKVDEALYKSTIVTYQQVYPSF
jgi:hypothetical protein